MSDIPDIVWLAIVLAGVGLTVLIYRWRKSRNDPNEKLPPCCRP